MSRTFKETLNMQCQYSSRSTSWSVWCGL